MTSAAERDEEVYAGTVLLRRHSSQYYTTGLQHKGIIEFHSVSNVDEDEDVDEDGDLNIIQSQRVSLTEPEHKHADQAQESGRCPKVRQWLNSVGQSLDNYFEITKRGSTIATEIRGGTVAFLTLAYIILLNPHILALSGMPQVYAASSTCLCSAVASLICGIGGNLPVGCGPGVGLSAYFSFGMLPSIVASNPEIPDPYLTGLLMAFLSGVCVFLLTIINFTPWLVKNLPHFFKIATIVGMGFFLAFVGMIDLKLVISGASAGSSSILLLGNMGSWLIWLALMNLLAIATFKYFQLNGGLLICIIVTTALYFLILLYIPPTWVSLPVFLNPGLVLAQGFRWTTLPLSTTISSVISFILIIVLDVSGVTFGIGRIANLVKKDEQGNWYVVGQKWALIGTSVGTMLAGITGCSPIIICIETCAGASAGSRTGLSACVIAFYFLLAMFLGPIFGQVPAAATAPVLIFIGTIMMSEVSQINWDNMRIAIPAFLCISMMPFTYSISNGLFFGLGAYACTYLTTLQWVFQPFVAKLLRMEGKPTFDQRFMYANWSPTSVDSGSRHSLQSKSKSNEDTSNVIQMTGPRHTMSTEDDDEDDGDAERRDSY